jgi:hypothetical protein
MIYRRRLHEVDYAEEQRKTPRTFSFIAFRSSKIWYERRVMSIPSSSALRTRGTSLASSGESSASAPQFLPSGSGPDDPAPVIPSAMEEIFTLYKSRHIMHHLVMQLLMNRTPRAERIARFTTALVRLPCSFSQS